MAMAVQVEFLQAISCVCCFLVLDGWGGGSCVSGGSVEAQFALSIFLYALV